MSQESQEYQFQVSDSARLQVANVRGSTEVTAGEDGLISVVAVKHLDTGNARLTQVQIEQQADGTVVVETRYEPGGSLMFGDRPCKVSYQIRVPRHCTLKVSGVSNTTLVEGIEGSLNISTVSGSLTVKEVSGSLRLNSVSGEIQARQLSGSLNLDTVSGKAHLEDANLQSVSCSTVSGALVLDLSSQTHMDDCHYRFRSVSGSVRLLVPEQAGFSVETTTVSGACRTSLPVSYLHRSRGHERLQVNQGGARLLFNSVFGDLVLATPNGPSSTDSARPESHEISEAPTQVPGSDSASDAQYSSIDILQEVEAGRMTVAEALRLLA